MSSSETISADDEYFRVEYLETPVKSVNDKKEYSVIKLPNGFTALLISDVYSNARAAKDQYKKKENNFEEFITKHNNFIYTLTECENTTFYFEIQEEYLLSAFDHFAAILIKPLIKKDTFKQWRTKVKKELQIASLSYKNQKEQLFSSFARSGHPASKLYKLHKDNYKLCNMDDSKVYEEVDKFRKRHYNAHRITLAVQASLPLNKLEKYVIKGFSDVLSNKLPPDDFTEFKDGVSFDTSAFRKIYRITSINNINQLEVTWATPSIFDFYKSKPHRYISWIIEYKGKGSLTSYLRKKWNCEVTCNNESSFTT